MEQDQSYKLKKLLKYLEKVKGRHTELISVYVPKDYNLNLVTTQLNQEYGTAVNIKSKSTRKNVMNALTKMLQELKKYKKTLPNGMAIFCGNVSEKPGEEDWVLEVIQPPIPLNIRIYRCDQKFVTEPFKDLLEVKKVYGLVVMDTREAVIGLLKGKSIEILKEIDSHVFGKFRAGGQSAQRFQRVREGLKKEFYKEVAATLRTSLNNKEIAGILLGGPGASKEELAEGYLGPLKQKVIATKDLANTNISGLNELVERSKEVLEQESIIQEKEEVKKFMELLAQDSPIVSYGENDVMEAIKKGSAEKILISESVDDKKIDHVIEEAKKYGTTIKIISTETKEGTQFEELSGFGAILRYRLE
ncbi:MAG: peptide chain release factor 1 [Nanoarchaeota archaeon]|nr:peptide chain release factor 1 [Nanoarchaeota archaeon]